MQWSKDIDCAWYFLQAGCSLVLLWRWRQYIPPKSHWLETSSPCYATLGTSRFSLVFLCFRRSHECQFRHIPTPRPGRTINTAKDIIYCCVCRVAAVCVLCAAAPCRAWEQSDAYRSRYEEVLLLRSSRHRRSIPGPSRSISSRSRLKRISVGTWEIELTCAETNRRCTVEEDFSGS
jgi:hypothetical protein